MRGRFLQVHGFLIIRGALSGSELTECAALASRGVVPAALATHEVVLRYVEQLCRSAWCVDQNSFLGPSLLFLPVLKKVPILHPGPDRHLDSPAALVDGWPAAAVPGRRRRTQLSGGGTPHDPGRAYHHQNGVAQGRWCQGLHAVFALTDAPSTGAGLVLLPASHTLNVPIPEAVLRGEDDYLQSLGMELQPELRAGDLLLHAATLARGLSPLPAAGATPPVLCSCGYTAVFARPSGPAADVEYSGERRWLQGLGPAEAAVLGLPAADGSFPAVISDGSTARVETPEEVAARAGRPFHPAGFSLGPPDPALVDELEFFFWELTGFLVVRSVMDAAWLAEANAVVDKHQHTVEYPGPSTASGTASGTDKMRGTGRPSLDLMELDDTDLRPFVRMLAHPQLVQRLNWMCGGHFRAEQLGSVIMSRRGTAGQGLHGNGAPVYPNTSWWDCE